MVEYLRPITTSVMKNKLSSFVAWRPNYFWPSLCLHVWRIVIIEGRTAKPHSPPLCFYPIILLPVESVAAHWTVWWRIVKFGTLIRDSVLTLVANFYFYFILFSFNFFFNYHSLPNNTVTLEMEIGQKNCNVWFCLPLLPLMKCY